jgi:hypothetical protein
MTKDDPGPGACPACRGRGWKLVRSRTALVIGTLLRGSAAVTRRYCLECDGTGLAP